MSPGPRPLRPGGYFPPDAPVSDRDALRVGCPLCGSLPGQRCVYMKDIWQGSSLSYRQGHVVHRKGTPTARAHGPRRAAAREVRTARWRKENRAAAARLDAVRKSRRAPIAAALAEFDRREYEALRDWLKDYGAILWTAVRPDGTPRGASYALQDGLAEWDRAFASAARSAREEAR